ncbi:hypothetical protein MNB_SM-3-1166 [hydrothermal vent metagenome]|uniref:Endonuclease/exonuclease/phosphatase domain-containing protein n=1 Tax=hydrothermal vent metagenome TaxID=652676 RepID=A0A1W1D539_9ZZZZ
MKIVVFLLVFFISLFGEHTLKIANYNVDNLFDLIRDGHEYKEYIPFTHSNYNTITYRIKLKHLSRVIRDMDADIVALEEVESEVALKDLRYQLKRDGLYYPYYKIANKKNTTVKVALLSKIPFVYAKELVVGGYSYKYRNILEVKFRLGNEDLYLFINHWKAKSGAESQRIVSAKVLRKRVEALGVDKNIILVGDFNSDYEEYKKFKRDRKLNNTGGKTGINHILRTLHQTQKATKVTYKRGEFYNLWYDVDKDERYSYIFHRKKITLDNMIISQSLLQPKGIHYKPASFHHFAPKYLFHKRYIARWEIDRRTKQHKGKGYSDHLPIIATFLY